MGIATVRFLHCVVTKLTCCPATAEVPTEAILAAAAPHQRQLVLNPSHISHASSIVQNSCDSRSGRG